MRPWRPALFLTRRLLIVRKGDRWYRDVFPPKISPITLVALLFTIVAMFGLKGGDVPRLPFDAVRIAIPLMLYFAIQFMVGFAMGRLIARDHPRITAIAFTAAGNNSNWPLPSPSPPMVLPRRSLSPWSSGRWSRCRC